MFSRPMPWKLPKMRTSRSGSAKGSGRSSTPFTTLNTALLAPMPNASANTAASAKPGLLRRTRSA